MHYSKQILNVKLDFGYTYTDVMSIIEDLLVKKEPGHYICTTNPEFVMDAQVDLQFRDIINKSDLSVPDGLGVLLARDYLTSIETSTFPNKYAKFYKSLIQGITLGFSASTIAKLSKETITGVELTNKLAELSAKKKYSIYLLGGSYGNGSVGDMATDAKKVLESRYPGVNIIGATSAFSRLAKDDEATLQFVKSDMAKNDIDHIDILLVAYNHNYQDKWITRNAHKIPATVSMGVGRTFALLVGNQSKEPSYMNSHGLSWLYRLVTQPSRISRALKAFPVFPLKLFISTLK